MSEAGRLDWPLPPYFERAAVPLGAAAETCVVEFFSRGGMAGRLLQFRPEDGVIEIAATGTDAGSPVPIGDLRCLRLEAPIGLKAQLPAPSAHGDMRLSADKRRFAIAYRDGRRDAGETRGYLHDRIGSYLYAVLDDTRCERRYVPDAAGKLQIGESLADILVRDMVLTVPQVEEARRGRDALHGRKLGELLVERRIVTQAQLDAALRRQEQGVPSARLGDILVSQGVLTQEKLEKALKAQMRDRAMPLGDLLVQSGLARREDIVRGLAAKLGIPSVDVRSFPVDAKVLGLVPPDLALASLVLPLYRDGNMLVVATANPLDADLLRRLQFVTDLRVVPVLAGAEEVAARLQRERRAAEAPATKPAGTVPSAPEDGAHNLAHLLEAENVREPDLASVESASDSKLVRLVNRMILDANAQGASDIHIETNPGDSRTRIRMRRDGVMVDYIDLPATVRSALVSRIKIMASLDISEHRHPQDGKISFRQFGPAELDLRVAVIPTTDGLEDIVIRLLSSAKPIPIDKLGLGERDFGHITRLAGRSFGLLLVCGPTGSGKTTTLHSVLGHINTPELKIWTAEDPIEIRQEGLRQVQVNARIGFTFAAAMRSFLRADPDVIMVGEIRDTETARIAVEASLTGHLVFSTLHTNSAAESIVRLLDLGMDPFNFADALLGILAQRLVRRLCRDCCQRVEASEAEIIALAGEFCKETPLQVADTVAAWRREYGGVDGRIGLSQPRGCDACNGSGYRGRLGVYELLVSSNALKKQIQARAPARQLLGTCLEEGMSTLMQDGIRKTLQGLTDFAQVREACS